ncbi:MAG TPA: hypothetical protein VGC96_13280 [Candidatus Elarobacter sp.]
MTTAPPSPAPIGFNDLLSRSWALFKRNWAIALPPVIATMIFLVMIGAFTAAIVVAAIAKAGAPRASGTDAFIGLMVLGLLLCLVLGLVLILWGHLAMYGMADAAWSRGTATFADGFSAFRTRFGASLLALIGIIGLGFAALILMFPTLGLALLALPLVTMYVFPSVVSGGRGGFEAIGESFRLVRRFFVSSAVTLLILYAIAYGLGFLGAIGIVPLEFAMMPGGSNAPPVIPPLPMIVVCGGIYFASILVSLAYGGFQAVVLVGLYRDLMAQPPKEEPLPVRPPGTLPPPNAIMPS